MLCLTPPPTFNRGSLRAAARFLPRLLFGKRRRVKLLGLLLFFKLRYHVIIHTEEPLSRLARRTEVRLWVDGFEAFSRMERLIRRARHTIIIQMFIWKNDEVGRHIAMLLLQAADRGVAVTIMKEAVGDFFETRGDFLATRASPDPLWQRFWRHPHISIRHAEENDHAKVFVFDGDTLLLSGMNIAEEYLGSWHDYLVELRGSTFVQQFLLEKGGGRSGPVHLILNRGERCEIRAELERLIAEARSSIVLEHCYFSDARVASLLARRSREGIRITIILPERPDLHYHANMQAVAKLLAESDPDYLQVLLYPGIVHGKICLVDRRVAFLGSANVMASSLDTMGEVNVVVSGKYRRALVKLREVLRRDILKSRPLTSPPRLRFLAKWLAFIGL